MIFKIKVPCHLTWSELDSTEHIKKRFCSSCNKCIHDFRESSPEEILLVLKTTKDAEICGILPDQEEPAALTKSNINYKRFPSWVMVLAVALFSCKTKKPVRRANPGFIEIQNLKLDYTPIKTPKYSETDHPSG